jgi:pyruvate formate lyase activating enzyme
VVASKTYGRYTSLALDPIEKKPLARFYPGAKILSIGSFGCNLDCSFCQNWEIARPSPKGDTLTTIATRATHQVSPESLVAKACELQDQGNIGIAYTYTEPLVGYEFVRDTAKLAHNAGLKNVLVTNGYANLPVVREVFEHIDAANIDLKAFSQDFYDFVGAPRGLATVMQTIRHAARHCHVEITTLVIPSLNDSPEQMAAQSQWIANISPDIPLHLSRFFPAHRMPDTPPTPRATLNQLEQVASEYLHYVYLGNV